jgi:predicted N-acetyltransferase YhbS
VINARVVALGGESEESAAGVARWFAHPALDPPADMRIAVADAGALEGYADVGAPEDGSPKAWVDLRVVPGCPESLALLFGWAQARGAERAGAGGKIQFFVDERDHELRASLDEAGYAVVRSSYEMERALGGDLEAPVWPAGIEARPLAERDAEAIHAACDEAFADHWGYSPQSFEGWRALNLVPGEDTSLSRVAWDGDEIAGVTVGGVGPLAGRRPWRRRGLGEALLRESFLAFAERGKRAAGLGVDAENTTGAVSLYERVGMHVVRRSDTWERTA